MLSNFGNNWIKKIALTTKLDSAYGLIQFGLPQNFFYGVISKLDRIESHYIYQCKDLGSLVIHFS